MSVSNNHLSTMDGPRAAIATLLIFLAIAFVPSIIGASFRPDAWYEALIKPSWNPPSWLFGPVWTVLYTLIGYAGYLAWRSSTASQRVGAFGIYAIQLLLNALWSPLFFGYHSPGLALVNIVAQWVAISLNIFAFYRIKPAAGLLLTPYLLWVTFALALNASIRILNR
jgi:translocator protein